MLHVRHQTGQTCIPMSEDTGESSCRPRELIGGVVKEDHAILDRTILLIGVYVTFCLLMRRKFVVVGLSPQQQS